jgi:hypothetical protein
MIKNGEPNESINASKTLLDAITKLFRIKLDSGFFQIAEKMREERPQKEAEKDLEKLDRQGLDELLAVFDRAEERKIKRALETKNKQSQNIDLPVLQ